MAGEDGVDEIQLAGRWYANTFRVGQNALEFKIDCGQDTETDVMTVYFRVIASPLNARELFRLLGVGLLYYADTFGPIDDADPAGNHRSESLSHLVIGEVSQFLRHTLWLGLKDDATTSQLVAAELDIVLSNPAQPLVQPAGGGQQLTRQLSLWLYQVVPNEHLRNMEFMRKTDQGDDTAEFYPPLVLNLLYLLTPSTGSDLGDQQVLGRALQIFHDQSILRMVSMQDPNRTEELHISLCPRTIEELAEVWEAMQQPYRLSVCYEVRVVRIDSLRRRSGGRVMDRATQVDSLAEA